MYENGIYQHQEHIFDAIQRIVGKIFVKEILDNDIEGARHAIESIKFSDTDATSFKSIHGLLFLSFSLLVFSKFVFLVEFIIGSRKSTSEMTEPRFIR